jgi:CBS domain-containing protein
MTVAPSSTAQREGPLTREVREIMTPGVVSIPADASIRQAYGAIAAHKVHAVLVVERKSGGPLGWVTAGGLLHWALEPSHHHTAGQAVCEPVHTLSPSASVREAAELLMRPGVSHVLVAHRGDSAPEGVVSDVDVVRLVSCRQTRG